MRSADGDGRAVRTAASDDNNAVIQLLSPDNVSRCRLASRSAVAQRLNASAAPETSAASTPRRLAESLEAAAGSAVSRRERPPGVGE